MTGSGKALHHVYAKDGQKMESVGKWKKDSIAHTLDKNLSPTKNGRRGMITKHLQGTFKFHRCLRSVFPSECAAALW
ncbi:hypothetical protein SKAU_G00305900 [Synaphobranchus kaupii]|uniref:Uncharacterized protein n=1 Tax=Synaphobranchus kaupii TaxID=118154 RepID=A0A9Q1EQK3_SYNKA|nr:hypothetical protein SKAU_G00305900 [Synaphobranchus kaupii]